MQSINKIVYTYLFNWSLVDLQCYVSCRCTQSDSVIHTYASILVQTPFHYNVALNRHSSVFLLQGRFASRLQAGLGAHPLPLCFPIVCASSDSGLSFMHTVLTPAPGARPGRSLPGQLGECARHPRPHPKYVILKLWPYETPETPGIFLRPGGEITPLVTSQWVSTGGWCGLSHTGHPRCGAGCLGNLLPPVFPLTEAKGRDLGQNPGFPGAVPKATNY